MRLEIFRERLGTPPLKAEIESWRDKLPESINVDIEEVCNLRCPHCALPQQMQKREIRRRKGGLVASPHIDTENLIRAFEEIASRNPSTAIQITANGEPLLHPDKERVICHPARLGLDVGLTTNGILLSSSLVETFCLAGVRMINVSLDAATKETYAKVRPSPYPGINHFERVIQNIRAAVETRNSLAKTRHIRTTIMINMIIRPETVSEKEKFILLAQSLGVDRVSFRPLNTNAGLTQAELPKIVFSKSGVITHMEERKRWACHFPFKRLNLSGGENGQIRVTYCPHGWDREEFNVGMYPKDGTIGALWESEKFRKVREEHLQQSIDPTSPCATCPDWFWVTRVGESQATYTEIMTKDSSPT